MKVSGVICEYNPFHNGHKYMLDEMHRQGVSHILCIMSGNFVQRGELAIYDKYLRAKCAVKNGADLVIELPVPYSLATAETFARGAVGILNKLGCIDKLYFGSESSQKELEKCFEETEKEEFNTKLKILLNEGYSYPTAFSLALNNSVADTPNNILALEYLKQLKLLNSSIQPQTILRKAVSHDSKIGCDEFMSASALRELIFNDKLTHKYMPQDCYDLVCESKESGEMPADIKKIELAVLSKLRFMKEEDLSKIADVNEGLEYRIINAISNSAGLDELQNNILTKRYTNAKIRRIILSAFLGVEKVMQKRIPNYINVIACNEKGLEILREIKTCGNVKIVTRYKNREELSKEDKLLYDFTERCDNQYALALPNIKKSFCDRERKFVVE